MSGQLVPVGGGPPLPLLQQRLVLGRASECDLPISGKSVSGRHCELELVDGYWWVRDLESHNGTGINGVRCTHKRIEPGEVLWVAKQRFRVSYKVPSGSAGAASADEELAAQFLFADPPSDDPPSEPTPSEPTPPVSSPSQQRVPVTARPPRREQVRPSRSAPSQILGQLVPCGGGDPILLVKEDLLVGRRSHCDIQLKSTTVSSEHCRLFLEGGYWFVEDLNSRNGVRVDGVQVQRKALLPATILAISKNRYSIEYTPTGQGPPPEENLFSQSLLEKAGLQKQMDAPIPPSWANDDGAAERRPKYTLED